jgi:hypothetical protein
VDHPAYPNHHQQHAASHYYMPNWGNRGMLNPIAPTASAPNGMMLPQGYMLHPTHPGGGGGGGQIFVPPNQLYSSQAPADPVVQDVESGPAVPAVVDVADAIDVATAAEAVEEWINVARSRPQLCLVWPWTHNCSACTIHGGTIEVQHWLYSYQGLHAANTSQWQQLDYATDSLWTMSCYMYSDLRAKGFLLFFSSGLQPHTQHAL